MVKVWREMVQKGLLEAKIPPDGEENWWRPYVDDVKGLVHVYHPGNPSRDEGP
jgi:hypothetical protein